MKFYQIALIFILSPKLFAGIPEQITAQRAENMGIQILLWDGYDAQAKEMHQQHSMCTPISIFAPKIGIKDPKYTKVILTAMLMQDDKELVQSSFNVSLSEGQIEAVGCVPLIKPYKVNLILTYTIDNGYLMCPESYRLMDIASWLTSDINYK